MSTCTQHHPVKISNSATYHSIGHIWKISITVIIVSPSSIKMRSCPHILITQVCLQHSSVGSVHVWFNSICCATHVATRDERAVVSVGNSADWVLVRSAADNCRTVKLHLHCAIVAGVKHVVWGIGFELLREELMRLRTVEGCFLRCVIYLSKWNMTDQSLAAVKYTSTSRKVQTRGCPLLIVHC